MTVLAAAGGRKRRGVKPFTEATYAVADGVTIYQGSLVMFNLTTFRAHPAADTAGYHFVGIAAETVVGNAAGTNMIKVVFGHEELIDAASALTAAFVGKNCAAKDDNQVTTAADVTNDVLVGRVVELEGGDAWVQICVFAVTAS